MSKPRTTAGRQLLSELRTVRGLFEGRKDPGLLLDLLGQRIARIEAEAASQERPPYWVPCEQSHPGHSHEEWAQGRPPKEGLARDAHAIDVERLAAAMNAFAKRPLRDGMTMAEEIVYEYARLAGGSVASPEPSEQLALTDVEVGE